MHHTHRRIRHLCFISEIQSLYIVKVLIINLKMGPNNEKGKTRIMEKTACNLKLVIDQKSFKMNLMLRKVSLYPQNK